MMMMMAGQNRTANNGRTRLGLLDRDDDDSDFLFLGSKFCFKVDGWMDMDVDGWISKVLK